MDVVPLLAGLGGFFVGMLVWSRALRWIYSLWAVFKERQRDPAHRSRWRIVTVVFLHSGPWMLASILVLVGLILPSPHAEGWNGFFYGILASLVMQGFIVMWVVRLFQRKRKQMSTS